ncbi:MAG: DEAD/DEAH box helicase [Acidimicrobiales bacterium]
MSPSSTASAVRPVPTFAELGVPESIVHALDRRGITAPFEIQAVTIADALAGRDVCGRAPTGSGKTLAFGIPLVAGVDRAKPKRPTALILAPTRELAEQISTELRTFRGKTRIGVVYGGVGYGPQLRSLREGIEILVACPGRLEDLIEQGALSLADVNKVVLDEADRMADMGFMPSVRRLLDQTSPDRQTVLFSATLDGAVAKLTRDYQTNPVRHEVGDETPDITAAHHVFWKVDKASRTETTAAAVDAAWPAIIFCRTRHGSDRLAKQLGKLGIKSAAIHGGRSQNQRTRALAAFADNRVHCLVATDVAARGIHVDGVASVIHFDPPEDHKTYVHRSGRTARAGESGVVVSLLMSDQVRDAKRVQQQVGLSEPITEPDAAKVRELSTAPERRLTPPEPGDDSNGGSNKGGGDRGQRRSHNSGGGSKGRHNRRGPKSGQRNATPGNRSKSGNKSQAGNKSKSANAQSGNRSSSNGPKAGNRKARRAHLQPR